MNLFQQNKTSKITKAKTKKNFLHIYKELLIIIHIYFLQYVKCVNVIYNNNKKEQCDKKWHTIPFINENIKSKIIMQYF